MSTYKEQPVYAELPLAWLTLTRMDFRGLTGTLVANTVNWMFHGGTFAAIDGKHLVENSGDSFPDGDLSTFISHDGTVMDPLATVLSRRMKINRPSRRAIRTHANSLWVAQKLVSTLTRGTPAETGLHAVYIVANVLLWGYKSVPRVAGWREQLVYISECMLGSAADSHMHVPTIAELVDKTVEAFDYIEIARLYELRAHVERLRIAIGEADVRRKARAAGAELIFSKDFCETRLDLVDTTKSMIVGRLHFFVTHDCAISVADGVCCILSRSDIIRLRQLVYSIVSGLEATIAQAAMAPGKERRMVARIADTYMGQVLRVTSDGARAPRQREASVCKAYRRAFSAYLGELAGPCNAEETVLLWEEAHETSHARHCDLRAYREALDGFTIGTSFNLGKIYKICPAPDASPGATLLDRYEQVSNHNTISEDALETFRANLTAQILRAYIKASGHDLPLRDARRKPTWFSDYRQGKYDNIPSSEIHEYLDWEGTATMPDRHPLDSQCWKDSGLGWDDYDTATDPNRPMWGGNFILRMLHDVDCPMPGVRHMPTKHFHKVDTKPEGHKVPARGIYSGNIYDRLDQSWMEAAVAQVMRHHPSFMIGASVTERDSRVNAVTLPESNAAFVDYYYSFDIKGWSPLMPPEVQRVSHDIWGRLYNEVLFKNAHKINEGSTVYMAKQGYWGWFVNPGVNFEGYNGKEMTVILITLMSLAVQDWRELLVERGLCTVRVANRLAAMLFAFIDDGLGRVSVPRENCRMYLDSLKTATMRTFAHYGFTLEMFKCYPSDRFAIFLNEVYYAGRHVAHGTRAAMTLCSEKTESHTTIIERLEAVATGCRGAVTSGLDAHAASMMMFSQCWSHIKEWLTKPDPIVAATWTMAPRVWGGLGLPTMLQLATSGGGTAAEESASALQSWAKISPVARRAFLNCARSPMATRSPQSLLTSPMGGSLGVGSIVPTRVAGAVRLALTRMSNDGELSPLAHEILQYSSDSQLNEFSSAIIGTTKIIQEQLLRDIYSAHPHSIFSSFAARLEKSSTLQNLVGPKTMSNILKDNRYDVRKSYQTWAQRCA